MCVESLPDILNSHEILTFLLKLPGMLDLYDGSFSFLKSRTITAFENELLNMFGMRNEIIVK
jgi:hypothetical protein